MIAYRGQNRLALAHVAAGDEQRGILLQLRRSGEHCAVDHGADQTRFDIAATGDVIGAAVVRNDRVERVGDRIGVELEQDLLHGDVLGLVARQGSGAPCARRD